MWGLNYFSLFLLGGLPLLTFGYMYRQMKKLEQQPDGMAQQVLDVTLDAEGTFISVMGGTVPKKAKFVDKYGEWTEEIKTKQKKK